MASRECGMPVHLLRSRNFGLSGEPRIGDVPEKGGEVNIHHLNGYGSFPSQSILYFVNFSIPPKSARLSKGARLFEGARLYFRFLRWVLFFHSVSRDIMFSTFARMWSPSDQKLQ